MNRVEQGRLARQCRGESGGAAGDDRGGGRWPAWLAVLCALGLILVTSPKGSADDPPVQPEKETPPAARESEETGDSKKEAPADGEPAKPAKGKTRNPLTDLFIKTIKKAPGAPGTPNVPTEPVPEGKGTSPKHPKDATAPYDNKGANWMLKAQAQAQAGDWKPALEFLQKISELPEDSLFLDTSGTWVSLRGAAEELRGQAPPDLLEQYRVQFGGLAQQLLAEAIRTGRPEALGKVARGYFHTPAGYEAANRLGSIHLERGEYASAARWFQAIWKARPALSEDPEWRLKAAFAFKGASLTEPAQKLVEELGAGRPVVAGKPSDGARWYADNTFPGLLQSGSQTDWPVAYGSASRTGRLQGGTPLLLTRWQHRLTDSEPVREQMSNLMEDLVDAQSGPLPVIQPILVGGLAAFRTLHGVQVVEVESGRLLWSSIEQQALDRLLSGQAAQMQQNGMNGGMMFVRGGWAGWNGNFGYGIGSGESSPLCHLLFRNSNFGLLSSDGVRLFVVEDSQFLTNQQPGQTWWNPNAESGPSVGTRLTAYDLRTGRPLWEVGGSANGEELDPPLAGYFLFGPPVVDGNEMYLVGEATTGERSGQIRLLCLDPASGVELWSQLIAFADTGIEKDIGRRWFSAQPSLENGLIFCPTTVGWLVAVDRTTHSVVWGFRPPRPTTSRAVGPDGSEVGQMVQQFGLATVWNAAPPVAAGGRVVYTPVDPQVQTLFCIDQSTGKEVWNKPRGSGMYLAGVFDGVVLVVGRDTTVAYRLKDGEQAWTLKHTLPAGRGIAAEGNYHLPLTAGEVWTITIATGEVTSRTYLPEQSPGGVGNLLMSHGLVLSLDPFSLTAFEQKEAIIEQIAIRKGTNPEDPLALLREADLALLQRNYADAVGLLHRVRRDLLPPTDQPRHRQSLVESLAAVVRGDFARPEVEEHLTELQTLVSGPEETLMLRRLQADRYLASQQFRAAFDAYLQLAEDSVGKLVPQESSPGVQVRSDLWVAGKIIDLLAAAPEAERVAIEARVGELAAQALGGAAADRQRFLQRFPEHPAALDVRLRLAADFAQERDFADAEHQLRKVVRSTDPGRGALAVERLGHLFLDFGLEEDAHAIAGDLTGRWRDTPLPDGRTGLQAGETLHARFPSQVATRGELGWPGRGVKVERMAANYQNWVPQELNGLSHRVPFFSRYRMDVDPQSQRLEVVEGKTDATYWSHPLRVGAAGGDGGIPFARTSGHRVVLLQQGVVHALSPLERRTLWTRPLDSRTGGQQVYGRQQTPFLPMRPLSSGGNRQPIQPPQMTGALALASDEVVCLLGRRNLTVLDAETGEIRWQMQGSRLGMTVSGGERLLYLSSLDPQQQQQLMMMGMATAGTAGRARGAAGPVALRLIDGKRIEVPKLKEVQSKALLAVGDDFVMTGNVEGGVEVRRLDPLSGADRWKLKFRKGALGSVLDSERLAVLETATKEIPGNRLSIVELADGRMQTLDVVDTDVKAKNELFVFADPDSIFLVVNKPGGVQNYYNEQLPYVRVNGVVTAFNARDGKVRWKQAVSGQNLLLERFEFVPLLLFVSRKFDNRGQMNFWSMHLIVIDKLTGTRLLDEKSAQQPGFRSLTINAGERFLELRGWNDRTRLYATDETASLPPAANTPPATPQAIDGKPAEESKPPAEGKPAPQVQADQPGGSP